MRAGVFAALLLLPACQQPAEAGETNRLAPAPQRLADEANGLSTAIFAGGCYWGVEGVYSHLKGVKSAVAGFHGGLPATADYDRIGRGDTGHAEVVLVSYDPKQIRYDQLLQVYFSVVADPTTLNRQGPDVGTQYRTALIPLGAEQRAVAAAYLAQLDKARHWQAPIVTRIESYRRFHAGPESHQDFMARNPRHPYILRWDASKVEGLKRLFPQLYQGGFTKG